MAKPCLLESTPPLPRTAAPPPLGPRAWLSRLAGYRQPHLGRSLLELSVTLVPFVALWAVMWKCVAEGWWAALLLAVPAAGFLVRIFMIQHDCGHDSFFRRRWANAALGRVLGVLTFTPYDHWREKHAVHHATAGNLDRRGVGDVDTLTVREYLGLGRRGRLAYRFVRSPWVLLLVAPIWIFLLRHRLPAQLSDPLPAWVSTMGTNLAIVLVIAVLMTWLGVWNVLLVQGPITLLASASGIWLFHVQHQFERTSWEHEPGWTFHEAALHGSSFLDLPPILRWLTANIGVHHVHHLCSRIPSYRLGEVLRDHPELRAINRVTLADAVASFRLALWDEDRRRLVSFRAVRAAHG